MSLITIQEGQLGFIRLNRPEVFNSFDRSLALSFQRALDVYAWDSTVRAVLITGEGGAFCAGQDLREVVSGDGLSVDQMVDTYYNPIVRRLRQMEKPVVAAVNGAAAGAGANLALACDVVVASESAFFVQAFSHIGLVPDTGGTFMLPRLVGFQKASALMMLGERLSATDAERLGMIYKVYADANFLEQAEALARRLAEMPTKALAYTKHLLNRSFTSNLDEQLELERDWQHKAAATQDCREGVEAFKQKRSPNFKGK